MKATGIVRQVDDLGRIVIPIELRRAYGITERDPVEIFTTNEGIVLRPYTKGCVCCNEKETNLLVEHNGVYLCKECLKRFS